jgi:hypothetical protein
MSNQDVPGGRVELPTNPECFRGCSIAASNKSRAQDFSFALRRVQSDALRQESRLLFGNYLQLIAKSLGRSGMTAQMLGETGVKIDG